MPGRTTDIQQTFPARSLRPDERELVAEWLAAAGDVSSAYVSEQRIDDPAMYRRIAISVEGNGVFTHLIHAPFRNDCWIVLNVRHKPEVHQFDSLMEALNFVRPVLRRATDRPRDRRSKQAQGPQEDRFPAAQGTERHGPDRPQLDGYPFR
jgi:hypothetical protein